MAREIFRSDRVSSNELRARLTKHYTNKYFNLWFNSYKWTGLNYQQIDAIMRLLWSKGIIASTKIKNAEMLNLEGDSLVFGVYVPREYNVYMTLPIKIDLVLPKNVSFVNTNNLKVDKDAVIGYAQRDREPIYSSIRPLIDNVIDAEMLIKSTRKALKMPWLLACNEENKARLAELMNIIESDNDKLFASIDDINNISVFQTGVQYILDKLLQYKKDRENEILTYLGIDNVASEKKEHLVVDEVNANNDVINNSGDACLDCLKEFCERITNVLGVNVSIEAKSKPIVSEFNKEEGGNEDE